jgi:hypothetical protein
MLRSSFLSSSSSSICNKCRLLVATFGKSNNGVPLRTVVTTVPAQQQHHRLHSNSSLLLSSSRYGIRYNLETKKTSSLRLLSSTGSNTNHKSDQTDGSTKSTNTSTDGDGKQPPSSDSNEIVLTPGETVVAVSRLTMWAGIAVFATACAYYIAMELIPT